MKNYSVDIQIQDQISHNINALKDFAHYLFIFYIYIKETRLHLPRNFWYCDKFPGSAQYKKQLTNRTTNMISGH